MIIRPANEGDVERLAGLFNLCFNKEISRDEWLWKYNRSPLGSSSFVAEADDMVIAHYGGFRVNVSVRGREFKGYQGCDVMTRPDYRARIFSKRGIIVRLAEAFYSSAPMDFIYGFPSERHGKLMRLQLGFEQFKWITLLSKEISYRKRRNLHLFKRYIGWENITGEEIDSLWYLTKDSFTLTLKKESKYIFWRFRDRHGKRYEALLLRSLIKKRLLAWGVFAVKEEEIRILDFFGLTSKDRISLFRCMEDIACQYKLKRLLLWINPLEPDYKILLKDGFNPGKGIPYTIRIFNKALEPEIFMNSYCYRMGDYDDY